MNWSLLGVLSLFLVTILATFGASVFYIRHWAARQERLRTLHRRTEGSFFKRYIPPELREAYDRLERVEAGGARAGARRLQWFLTGTLAISVTALVSGTLFVNRDKFKAVIDLAPAELAALRPVAHRWTRLVDEHLPEMGHYVERLRERGFVLLSSDRDQTWLYDGTGFAKMALEHWTHFLKGWEIPYVLCTWEELAECKASGKDPVFVALAGHWNTAILEQLISHGASVVLYGPPAQALEPREDAFQWGGLRFEATGGPSFGSLALRGDRELTLGFDAGLVVDAQPAFWGYRVFSSAPQAVGVSGDHMIGGRVLTRLFAARLGAGRYVWFDFPPHPDDSNPEANFRHLEALSGAIYRYLLGDAYAAWATWPEGRRFAGFLSEDTEDKFHYARRVAELARERGYPMTWYILSNLAMKHRGLTRELASTGEIACHGDSHARFTEDSDRRQLERIARCRKVLRAITGAEVNGFRPPEERYNKETVDAVAASGMSHYFAETGGDRAVPVLERGGNGKTLVSIPRIGSDDYEMWYTDELDYKASLERAADDILWAEFLGGVLAFDFHTQYMDDDDHLKVVAYYGDRFKQNDCYFDTVGGIVDWWRFRFRLIRGEAVDRDKFAAYRPVLLSVGEDGELARIAAGFEDLAGLSAALPNLGTGPDDGPGDVPLRQPPFRHPGAEGNDPPAPVEAVGGPGEAAALPSAGQEAPVQAPPEPLVQAPPEPPVQAPPEPPVQAPPEPPVQAPPEPPRQPPPPSPEGGEAAMPAPAAGEVPPAPDASGDEPAPPQRQGPPQTDRQPPLPSSPGDAKPAMPADTVGGVAADGSPDAETVNEPLAAETDRLSADPADIPLYLTPLEADDADSDPASPQEDEPSDGDALLDLLLR